MNAELADFLRRTRAACDPHREGMPTDGRVRRVPGLRREEVALLAGISTGYYTRLEQGRRIVPSTQVVDAIARTLNLDEAGRTHLHSLINGSPRPQSRSRSAVQRVRPGLYQLLDTLDTQPALILGKRTDVLATNHLFRALFADFEQMPARERNYARWILLSDEAKSLYLDWEEHARAAVESLRLDAGNTADDPDTQKLVGELSLASPEFRRWWSEHRVLQRTFGSKRLHHPIVGELTVDYETLTLPGDPDQTLYVYTTPPDSPAREALGLLASWTQPQVPASGVLETRNHQDSMPRMTPTAD